MTDKKYSKDELAEMAEILRKAGSADGDTILAHITKEEAAVLKARGGAGTKDPVTGLPHFDAGRGGGYSQGESMRSGATEGRDNSKDDEDADREVAASMKASMERAVKSGMLSQEQADAVNTHMQTTSRDSGGRDSSKEQAPIIPTSKLPGYDSPGFVNNTAGALTSLDDTQVTKSKTRRVGDVVKTVLTGAQTFANLFQGDIPGAVAGGAATKRAAKELMNPGTTSNTFMPGSDKPRTMTESRGGNESAVKAPVADETDTKKLEETAANPEFNTFTGAPRKRKNYQSTILAGNSFINPSTPQMKKLLGS